MQATLHHDLYIEPTRFAREREKIFFDQWTCVARETDLLSAGSYAAVDIAGESIIIVRGDDWKLRALHNVCRHRSCELIDSTREQQKHGQFLALTARIGTSASECRAGCMLALLRVAITHPSKI
jgi:phenylpropionate dioxygenase-like ring-hydroxylating dioxygenase large terminal subunit